MAARRRSSKTRDLPPNLYVRNGYYSYRDPRTGTEYGLGRDKRTSINEAVKTNIELLSLYQEKSLLERISGEEEKTLHDWLDRYEKLISERGLKEKTLTDYKNKISAIRKRTNNIPLASVTTKMIADLLNQYITEGKPSMAKLMRSTLIDLFREAIAEGHIQNNPATATRPPKTEVKRSRLTLDEYSTIKKFAGNEAAWLPLAMDLALITAQRVGDICKMKWTDIHDTRLRVAQQKTGVKLAIPLSLDLKEANISIENVLHMCNTYCYGENILSSTRNKPLSPITVSRYFMRARKASGIVFTGEPPTFHEIRSLAARLYARQVSDSFAQHLLGHKSDSMAARYRDSRGKEWDLIDVEYRTNFE
ncbi:integrase [Salmonella enterica subsp. enterica serovar Newport]|nr:integrase [Salmonella enterica subsp. enterica serovar Newport]